MVIAPAAELELPQDSVWMLLPAEGLRLLVEAPGDDSGT